MMMDKDAILKFWFEELSPKQWYRKDPELDEEITGRFAAVHQAAVSGELYTWRDDLHGRLAEIIVLDQFSRNMFRGLPYAFANDPLALVLAQEVVKIDGVKSLKSFERSHILLPFMHSESQVVHKHALELYEFLQIDATWERKHKVIIDRFGRYPHRNEVLGRTSTAEELAFLEEPGSSF